jgi:cytochrome P450
MCRTLPDAAAAHASNQCHGVVDLDYGQHMSFLDELDELADEVSDDAQELRNRAVKLLETHAREHPDRLFKLLRTLKPVLLRHNLAIVTRYHDVVEVLGHDEAFSVQPYREKMVRLAGDFILGTDDSPRYERDISILRLAAPRSDVPVLAGYVNETAEALAAGANGRIDVADLAKRVPARLFGRWFGTPGPDEDTLMAWTLAIFEDIFVNVKNDPAIAAEADQASAALAAYLDEAIADRKATSDGTHDDVVGRLLAMQGTAATSFTDEEIRVNVIGLVCGFIPTIATATTFALDALLERPDALEDAQAAARADDDDALRAYLFEAMRLAPQGPGLFRRARTDFEVAEGSGHATKIPAGTLTFAATQSAMLDDDVVDDPDEFRLGRPAHHHLHFGVGLHQCFGRFANAMQIPLIAKAVLRRPGLARAPGAEGRLVKDGPFPKSLVLTFEGS